MRAKIKKATCMIIWSMLLISCKNHDKINKLTKEIEQISSKIITLDAELESKRKLISDFRMEKAEQLSHSKKIKDSVEACILESPIASAYLYKLDKDVIIVLEEYFEAETEEDRERILVTDIALTIYSRYNQELISSVKKEFQQFDQKKKDCMRKASDIQAHIDEEIQIIESKENEKKELNVQINLKHTELESENKKGFL